jgi:outer membrane protein OmpA-like peptidoglycan-associated protein
MMILLYVCITVLSGTSLFAHDTTLTRLRIGGGIAAGINQHSANFSRLTSFPACCPEYTSGSGFHLGYSLHLDYQPETNLFGMPYAYGVRVSGAGFSGVLTDDEEIGMVINGPNVTRGVARHTIDATFTTVGIEPYLNIQKIAGTQLSVSAGMFAGFPVSSTFNQKEELIEPTDLSYNFETGSRTRGISNGEIPRPASPFIAAVFGVGYMHELDARRAIEPRIETLIGLTDLTSAVSWGVTSFRVGVNVHYRVPKPTAAPPPPPPPPPPPVVETPKRVPVLSSKLMVPEMTPASLDGVVRVEIVREYLDAAPLLFFAKNSTEVLSGAQPSMRLQQNVASAITAYMRQQHDAKLTVIGSASYDEEPAVARERTAHVVRLLGISPERLEMQVVQQAKAEYPELAEEHRSVQFLVNGIPQIFRVERTRDSAETVQTLRVPVGHLVTCDTSCSSALTASIDGRLLRVGGSGPTYTVEIDSVAIRSMQQGQSVTIRGTVAFESTTASSEQQISYAVRPATSVAVVPVGQSLAAAGSGAPATLCYFDFNSSTITSFNEQVFAALQQAIANGKRAELVATTDHLGTDASNTALAERRANAAIEKLVSLGIPKDRISVGTYQTKANENGTPMERIANRSVKITIRD